MIWVIGLGGIFGAVTRFQVGKWITAKTASPFPAGTWVINLSGSFLLGAIAILHVQHLMSDWLWGLLGIGFLGAYTTFSTFGYETLQLMEKRNYLTAALYVLASVILGLLFAWFGWMVSEILL